MEAFMNGSHWIETPDYFEWWYFHFITDHGFTANLILHETDIFGLSKEPYVSMGVQLLGTQSKYYRKTLGQISINRNSIYLSTSDQLLLETEKEITISLNFPSGETFKAKIEKISQPLILNDGIIYENTSNKRQNLWVVNVPLGKFEGSFKADGVKHILRGSVYHDHQWGNILIQDFVSDWVWGHFGDQEESITYFLIQTQNGSQVQRFIKINHSQVGGFTEGGNASYITELSNQKKPEVYESEPIVIFPDGTKLSVGITKSNLMRSRINERYEGFSASYLRWVATVSYQDEKLHRLPGITEYMRIRKETKTVPVVKVFPVIILAGFSCSGKSTTSKKLVNRYRFDLMEQYVIYHNISSSKGYKRTRYWLADVGNENFVSEITVETVRRIQNLSSSKGVVIDASYGSRMHAILSSTLPNAQIITIAITTNQEERVQRMKGRMGSSLEGAEVELTFRDKFLSDVGLQDIIDKAEFKVENKGSIESVISEIYRILEKYGIIPQEL